MFGGLSKGTRRHSALLNFIMIQGKKLIAQSLLCDLKLISNTAKLGLPMVRRYAWMHLQPDDSVPLQGSSHNNNLKLAALLEYTCQHFP